MPTTVLIDDETHDILSEKQKEIKKKYGIKINMPEIVQFAVRGGIDKVEAQVVERIEETKKLELELNQIEQ